MSNLTHSRQFICSAPIQIARPEAMQYCYDRRGSSIPVENYARISGTQREGEPVSVWFGGMSYGIDSKANFEEMEDWLRSLYQNVAISGHTVHLEYEEPIRLTPYVPITGDGRAIK